MNEFTAKKVEPVRVPRDPKDKTKKREMGRRRPTLTPIIPTGNLLAISLIDLSHVSMSSWPNHKYVMSALTSYTKRKRTT
jgi:hypothetical protein